MREIITLFVSELRSLPTPLWGSLGRLVGASLGRSVKGIPVSDPPRGRPVGGGGVNPIWGYGGISPHQ